MPDCKCCGQPIYKENGLANAIPIEDNIRLEIKVRSKKMVRVFRVICDDQGNIMLEV